MCQIIKYILKSNRGKIYYTRVKFPCKMRVQLFIEPNSCLCTRPLTSLECPLYSNRIVN